NQNARAFIAWLMQNEIGILLPVAVKAPVVKNKLAKASLLDPLQKLFGNDLISVDIDAIERRDFSAMYGKWFHFFTTFVEKRLFGAALCKEIILKASATREPAPQ